MDVVRVGEVVRDIHFLGWNIGVMEVRDSQFVAAVRVEFDAPDAYKPDHYSTQYGRWWAIEDTDTDEGVVKTVFAAVKMAVEHETRELFMYKGKRPFNPHKRL